MKPQGISEIAASTGDAPQGCSPRFVEQAIETDQENVLLWPTCAQVRRCGGCCAQEKHHCVPVQTALRTVPVLRARYPYPGSPYFEFDGMMDMNVTDEISCTCQCLIMPHHCDILLHSYDPNECACRCNNEALSQNCLSPKKWNRTTCECECPGARRCSNQYELFNFRTCSCESASSSSNPELEVVPCNRRCRPGFIALSVGGQCECRPSVNWGNMVAGSLGNVQQLPNSARTTTTTPRPTTRSMRRRPRPRQRPRF